MLSMSCSNGVPLRVQSTMGETSKSCPSSQFATSSNMPASYLASKTAKVPRHDFEVRLASKLATPSRPSPMEALWTSCLANLGTARSAWTLSGRASRCTSLPCGLPSYKLDTCKCAMCTATAPRKCNRHRTAQTSWTAHRRPSESSPRSANRTPPKTCGSFWDRDVSAQASYS